MNTEKTSKTRQIYDISKKDLIYKNDFEYRKTVRQLFCMVSPNNPDLDEVDEITRDEQDYDAESTEHMMNYLFNQTKYNVGFQSLYDIAAARMFSMDRSIGLAVLCSYDYLALFHKCLCRFFEDQDEFDETSNEYQALYKKIA